MYPTMLTATSSALSDVGTTLTNMTGWLGDVVDALLASDGVLHSLWPFILVGFSVSIVMLSIKVIRSFSWGI